MTRFRADPLLGVARAIVTFFMALAVLVGIALVAGSVLALFNKAIIIGHVSSDMPTIPSGEVLTAIVLVLVLIAGMAALAFRFLQRLRQIIDSVGEGDPFIPENARRLQEMGWLTVGIEVISLPTGGIAQWISQHFEDAHVEFGLSPTGILLALVLFILARVFRKGAEMRAELEGTV